MISFLKTNTKLITYSLIFLLVVPILGAKFLIGFIGNILILLFLIPLFILLIAFLSLSSFKSRLKTCASCGAISLDSSNICSNCGFNLDNESQENYDINKPSSRIIEVKAEEVK